MSAVPIRIRLTAAFAVAMAAVLCLVFLFLYLRLQSSLDATLDNGLRSRSDDVSALVSQADSGLAEGGSSSRLSASGESFAQVLTRDGTVFDSTPGATGPALSPADVSALSSPTIFDNRHSPGIEGTARLLATPVTAQQRRLTLIVGTSTAERDDALGGLLSAFVIGGPIAILLASGLGYLLASAGLAPVEALRRRSEQVTLRRSGERLPLSRANDEIRRLGETLNAMLARLESSLKRERAFVADASHELRTPLAVLRAELEVTLRGGGYDETTRSALRSAAEEVDQLVRLTEDLLVLARAEDGELVINREQVNVAEFLQGMLTRDARDGGPDAPSCAVDCPSDLVVAADPQRLRQALGNLIDNARHYGADPISVQAHLVGEGVEISVTDAGPGFPSDFVDHAFERFSRADRGRKRDGSGLGLAIVRAIARAHGGEASIDQAGERSTVVITLPCHPHVIYLT